MKNVTVIQLSRLSRLWHDDSGQDLLEYALLIVLIVLVAVTAINPLGSTIAKAFSNANACLSSPGTSCT